MNHSELNPRCDHRSELGLGCARTEGHEGSHWLTSRPDEARADLVRQGFTTRTPRVQSQHLDQGGVR